MHRLKAVTSDKKLNFSKVKELFYIPINIIYFILEHIWELHIFKCYNHLQVNMLFSSQFLCQYKIPFLLLMKINFN